MENKSIETKVIDGVTQTFYKGARHSFNGKPAVDGPELKVWYNDGLKHRIDGPAMIYRNGKQYYYVEGIRSGDSLEEHLLYLETMNIEKPELKLSWYKRIWNYLFK